MNQVRNAPDRTGFTAPSKVLSNEYAQINSAMGKDRRIKPFILARVTTANPTYEVKDVAGNVVRTVNRNVGDVDLNGVANLLRTLNAPTFRDKFAGVNLAVLHQRTDARANATEKQDAEELSKIVASSLDSGVVAQTFDPGNRNALPISTKIDWYKAMKANQDVFMRTPEGQRISNSALSQLDKDQALLDQLQTVSGLPAATYNAMTSAQKVAAIRTWLDT